jgi:3-oxoacyl-[acyl-carrier-protein] synthase II
MTVPMLMPNAPAAAIEMEFSARAGARTVVSACASSTESLANAVEHLQAGLADVIIAGGTEASIHPLPLAAFASMQALSKQNDDPAHASKPYDEARDGFVLGEGAAALVLETEEHAKARGARIYAVVVGSAVTSDAHHITAPDPEGSAAARAMIAAVRAAGHDVADVKHVNAHATSTPVGDTAEAAAIRSAIGEHVLVTATKSQTGHLLGAAGALESVFTILALRDQVVPATANLDDPDDDPAVQALDIVRHEPRKATLTAAVNDSFGFGGHNIALVFTTA